MLRCVDAGKYSGNIAYYNGNIIEKSYLRNNVDVVDNTTSDPTNKSRIVEFENIQYLVGEDAKEYDLNTSKALLPHKLLTYTMIADSISSNNTEQIDLVISVPISTFKNKEEKVKFKDMIFNENGLITLKVDGDKKSFYLRNVTILPEGNGIVYQNVNKYKDKLAYICDIGGLNANFIVFDCLKMVKEASFTTNHGGMILEAEITSALNTAYNNNYQPYEIRHIVKKNDPIAEKAICEHIKNIQKAMKSNGWNLENEIIFTGGCVQILKNYIPKYFENYAISENIIYDNVLGMLAYGEMRYGK